MRHRTLPARLCISGDTPEEVPVHDRAGLIAAVAAAIYFEPDDDDRAAIVGHVDALLAGEGVDLGDGRLWLEPLLKLAEEEEPEAELEDCWHCGRQRQGPCSCRRSE